VKFAQLKKNSEIASFRVQSITADIQNVNISLNSPAFLDGLLPTKIEELKTFRENKTQDLQKTAAEEHRIAAELRKVRQRLIELDNPHFGLQPKLR
jgi:hypothetical protein